MATIIMIGMRDRWRWSNRTFSGYAALSNNDVVMNCSYNTGAKVLRARANQGRGGGGGIGAGCFSFVTIGSRSFASAACSLKQANIRRLDLIHPHPGNGCLEITRIRTQRGGRMFQRDQGRLRRELARSCLTA